MQTNALSRHKMQVALLAEPKTPLESSVFILLALRSRVRNYCSFPLAMKCVVASLHQALLCDCTAIRYTCAYKFTARSVVYGPLHVKARARVAGWKRRGLARKL